MGLSPLWGQIGGQVKLQMGKEHMDIVPESLQDEVYLDAVFGVKKTGDVGAATFLALAIFMAGTPAYSPRVRLMRAKGVN